MAFENFSMRFDFEFTMRQDAYPYAQDDGTGFLLVAGVAGNTIITFVDSPKCVHQMNVFADALSLALDDLQITFSGDYDYIYNSIMPFLSG